MKFILLLTTVFVLTGCQTFSMGKPWPVLPEKEKQVYLTSCEPLELLKVGDGMPELVNNIEQNYLKWHLCKAKVDSWITWYNNHWKDKGK